MTALASYSQKTTARGWPFPPLWVIRIHHEGDEELFVAGEFNGWQLPGVPMERGEAGVWEARVPLTTADLFRFACFLVDTRGFRAVSGATIEHSVD